MAYTTIDDPSAYFQTILYSGNETARSITLDGNSDLQPDWVWIKQRSRADPHILYDSVRGTTKELSSNTNTVEHTNTAGLTSFNSDGFSIGNHVDVNRNSTTFVAWNWKETATAGFDIVSYTGTGSARTISHSLSAVPQIIIIKHRDGDGAWNMYNANLGNNKAVELNTTSASFTTDIFNDTTPTSSVFSVKTSGHVNTNGDDYIAYLFAEKKGFSKFGSYTGNGSTDGTFVYTGFKPAWILVRNVEISEGAWVINDNKRNTFNPNSNTLTPHNSESENTGTDRTDFTSQGFKLRVGASTAWNGSGNTIIYMAFAENPFVTSTGVPACAR